MKKRYKFLLEKDGKIVSKSGDLTWEIDKWEHVDGKKVLCGNGLHCSKEIKQAFSYVQGEILAVVEVKGKCVASSDKEAYSDMRIVKAYRWSKKDSVALAIFSAELCLDEYEKLYPDDKRPRQAIEAARKVLKNDNEASRSAAESAARSAARSARSAAESAAWSAAWSAAAESARSAAESAAWSAAESAAAESARSAARSGIMAKIEEWLVDHIDEMEEYKETNNA